VQQNLQVYFTKRWVAALDKMQVEALSSLRQESNIAIPQELFIIPNPEIHAIINDESLACEIGGAGLVARSGGEVTNSATMSIIEEPPHA